MGTITKPQIQKLHCLYRKLGIDSKEMIQNFTHGRTDSTTGLTKDEAIQMITALQATDPEQRQYQTNNLLTIKNTCMDTATISNKKMAALVNVTAMFNREVFSIFSYGGIEELTATIDLLYKNMFVYSLPCTDLDYNLLNYEDRYAVNEVYELLKAVLEIALKYDFTHFNKEVILLNACEAETIATLFKSLTYGKDVYVKLLDEMIITSVLYKPVILESGVSHDTVSIYFWCKQLKVIFNGYTGVVRQ